MLRWSAFLAITIIFTVISRRPLRNPRAHGFYRYFAFVGIAALVLYNQPRWFVRPFSAGQCLSWALLLTSIMLVIYGTIHLRQMGGYQKRQTTPENLSFENTQHLVVEGLYRYIRHPMYTSLLFLAWGAFLKRIDILTIIVVSIVTLALFLTAKVEESENIIFFGSTYQKYRHRSKMFIPFVF